MKKQRINWIYKDDLDAYFSKSKKGTKDSKEYVEVPEDIEIYKVPTRLERLHAERERLEKQLEGMKEPSDEELIEEGRMMHPYYFDKEELKRVEAEIKKLSDGDNQR